MAGEVASPSLKTRRAGNTNKRKEETQVGVTESWNCVTSCQSADPGMTRALPTQAVGRYVRSLDFSHLFGREGSCVIHGICYV